MSVSPKLISAPITTTHPYLWVIGDDVNGQAIDQLAPGTMVGDRFQVISGHLWVDTQVERPLEREMVLPDAVIPYLKLYANRLHLPEVYGLYAAEETAHPLVLLSNIPVNPKDGMLLPTIETIWETASPVRQLSWLWQMGQLWTVLDSQGVAASLLEPNNIHVDGWRVRLHELLSDSTQSQDSSSLETLGMVWAAWAETAHASIQQTIHEMSDALQKPGASWQAIAPTLNDALVQQAALSSLSLDIAGATTAGQGRSLNEDACYPITFSVNGTIVDEADELQPRVAIICDGIGGHSGGEVASQLTVRALKLQLRALFSDLASEPTPLSPDVIMRQIEAAIRVVNNLVAFQNNEQSRQARQRMGTTLVMAIQVPQQVMTPSGPLNTHELYIANVGDSRAYWLTPDGCHCLTVDDDVRTREVLEGRSLPVEAARRTDAIALTQALGTRSGEYLHIRLQRFIIDDNGVLLLCSDGLSDGGLIEHYWHSMVNRVLRNQLSLKKAAGIWLKLADQYNGHDNASVVLMRCQITQESIDSDAPPDAASMPFHSLTLDTTDSNLTSPSEAEPQSDYSQDASSISLGEAQDLDVNDFDASDLIDTHDANEALTFQMENEGVEYMDSSAFQSVGDSKEFEALARTLLEASAPQETILEEEEEDQEPSGWGVFAVAVCLSIVMFTLGAGGVFAWRRYAPTTFNETLEQTIDSLSKVLKLPGSSEGTQE